MDSDLISRRAALALGTVATALTLAPSHAKARSTGIGRTADQDVVIVGGSFAGLSAAMQLARARRRILVIDAALPRNRFAEASHGFLGQDGKTPREIVDLGRKQLQAYPTVSFLDGHALSVQAIEGGFTIETSTSERMKASRLVIATGVKDELPAVAGMAERWGVGVLHCPYCHGYEVADRQLGVFGTSELSIHQAAIVADWGPVTLFTQGVVNANPDQLALLKARKVNIERSPIVELLGRGRTLEAVRLEDGRNVPLGAMFLMPRTRFVSDLATALGCDLENGPMGPYLKVDERKQTSVPGVFAAGDVAAPFPNATFASAAGVAAGGAAHQSLIFS